MPSSETNYCYHCGGHHPREAMRQIAAKHGKKWCCIRSIEATRKSSTRRDAFGKAVTAINRAENKTRINARLHAERLTSTRTATLARHPAAT